MARTKNVNGVEVALTIEEETARNQEEKSFADGATQRNILGAIHRLESQVTNRRLREAYADSTWLDAQEALIATERAKLAE